MEGRERARRAYERGRIWVAVERGAPALLFGAAALVVAAAPITIMLCAVGVALVAAGLVYVGGPAGRAVPAGLVAGIAPFALPLIVRGQVCPMDGSCQAWCVTACSVGGVVAGAWLGWRSSREAGGILWLAAGLLLAATCGAMGCACVGAPGVAGMLAGAVAGAPVARAARATWGT